MANRAALKYHGATLPELSRLALNDTVHPDDLAALTSAWTGAVLSHDPFDVEARRRDAAGTYHWFSMHGFPLTGVDGRVAYWYVVERDIDDRRQAEALLAGEKRLLEMVALAQPLPAILDALCRIVEEIAPECYCSVVLIDENGERLQHTAAPSLPTSFRDAITGRPVNADSGPCAMAAHLREQVIAGDISVETRWDAYAWRPLALAHGLIPRPLDCDAGDVREALDEVLIQFGRDPRSAVVDRECAEGFARS